MSSEVQNNEEKEVNAARTRYLKLVDESPLGEKEKEACRDWIENGSDSRDIKTLEKCIDSFADAVRSSQQLMEKYTAKTQKAIADDVFSPIHKEENLKVFEKLSFEEKQKWIDKCDLDDKERIRVRDEFRRLPKAVRGEKYDEFRNAGLTKRKTSVAEWKFQHNELKAEFIALPKEVQQKYRDEFRSCGLTGRAQLLRSLRSVAGGMERGESAESQELDRRYQKMARKMVEDNLLAPDSYKAYAQEWYPSLSLPEKRKMLLNSELTTRLKERTAVRDEFYKLPESLRKPHELTFRNIDLDRRIQLLGALTGRAETSSFSVNYSDREIEEKLKRELEGDNVVKEKASVFTVVDMLAQQRRKSEIELNATQTETLVKNAATSGREVNEHQEVDIEHLTNKRDERFSIIKFMRGMLSRGVDRMRTPNVTLRDKQKREVSSIGFQPHVDHVRAELEVLITQRVSRKLPGVDPKRLSQIAHKMNFHRDLLRKEAV